MSGLATFPDTLDEERITSGLLRDFAHPPAASRDQPSRLARSMHFDNTWIEPAPDRDTNTAVAPIRISFPDAATLFRGRICEDIAEAIAEAESEGEPVPRKHTTESGYRLARDLADAIHDYSHLRYAGFLEESGWISIVVQSLWTHRRINLRIDPNSSTALVVTVDAASLVTTAPLGDIGELAQWLIGRAQ